MAIKYPENAATASNGIFKFLRTAPGDSHNLNLNGSSTPINAEWGPPAGRNAIMARLNLFFENTTIQAESFAGITALTNGLELRIVDAAGDTIIDYTDGVPFKTHHQIATLAGTDSVRDTDVGNAADVVIVRWTMEKSGRKLWLRPGERMRIVIADDLTGITTFFAHIQGYYGDPR